MSYFNADEIFEIAEQVERNGARFYNRAAEMIEEPRSHKILVSLAAAEVQHEKIFIAMRADIQKAGQIPTVDPDFDLQGEAALYLQAIADGQVFDVRVSPADLLTGEETIEDILRIALEREKDAVIFYLGIKDMVSENLGKNEIDRIIKEEMAHVTIISKELAALNR